MKSPRPEVGMTLRREGASQFTKRSDAALVSIPPIMLNKAKCNQNAACCD